MSSGRHLELAAKFYVVSILHRLGAEANVTFAQPDNVDITVVQESGQALTVDVKMLRGTKPKFLGLADSIPLIGLKKRQHSFSGYWQQSQQLVRAALDGCRYRDLFERQLRIV